MGFFSKQKNTIKNESEKLDYECEYCKKTSSNFLRTINMVTNTSYIRCALCKRKWTSEDFIWNRKKILLEDEWAMAGVRTLNKEEMKVIEEDLIPTVKKQEEKVYHCKLCDEVFTKPVHIRYHYKKVHSQKVGTADYVEPESEHVPEPEPINQQDLIDDDLVENQDIPTKVYPEPNPDEEHKEDYSDLI